jgi:Xaa-Pro dipeptidase
VLNAQKFVLKNMKPNVVYLDLYDCVVEIIATELLRFGFLKGRLDDLLENSIAELFMPHGLGHFLGIDVHDPPFIDWDIKLQEGMVITVEPVRFPELTHQGIYFIKNILEKAFNDSKQRKYLNIEKCRKYLEFGGIRIEDDVVITKDGFEMLTQVPKEISEIEKLFQ